jgi:hypothetical protein
MLRLLRSLVPARVAILLASEFTLTYVCYVAAVLIVVRVDPAGFFDDRGWLRIALVAISVTAGIYFHDLYSDFRIRSRVALVQRVMVVAGSAFLIQAVLGYVRLEHLMLPHWVMIAGAALRSCFFPLGGFCIAVCCLKSCPPNASCSWEDPISCRRSRRT